MTMKPWLVTTVVLAACLDSSPDAPPPSLLPPPLHQATTTDPAPQVPSTFCATHALVTFVIDDGWLTDYTVKKPIFDAHHAVAVSAIISGRRGMTDDQLRELERDGWEIASHSRTHPDLTRLTRLDLQSEIGGSKADLEAIGLHVSAFVYPWGLHNALVSRIARQFYQSAARVGWGLNDWDAGDPFDLGRANFGTQYGTPKTNTLASYESQVDVARTKGRWLIYMIHELQGSDAENLNALLGYIDGQSIPIVTLSQGAALWSKCHPQATSAITP